MYKMNDLCQFVDQVEKEAAREDTKAPSEVCTCPQPDVLMNERVYNICRDVQELPPMEKDGSQSASFKFTPKIVSLSSFSGAEKLVLSGLSSSRLAPLGALWHLPFAIDGPSTGFLGQFLSSASARRVLCEPNSTAPESFRGAIIEFGRALSDSCPLPGATWSISTKTAHQVHGEILYPLNSKEEEPYAYIVCSGSDLAGNHRGFLSRKANAFLIPRRTSLSDFHALRNAPSQDDKKAVSSSSSTSSSAEPSFREIADEKQAKLEVDAETDSRCDAVYWKVHKLRTRVRDLHTHALPVLSHEDIDTAKLVLLSPDDAVWFAGLLVVRFYSTIFSETQRRTSSVVSVMFFLQQLRGLIGSLEATEVGLIVRIATMLERRRLLAQFDCSYAVSDGRALTLVTSCRLDQHLSKGVLLGHDRTLLKIAQYHLSLSGFGDAGAFVYATLAFLQCRDDTDLLYEAMSIIHRAAGTPNKPSFCRVRQGMGLLLELAELACSSAADTVLQERFRALESILATRSRSQALPKAKPKQVWFDSCANLPRASTADSVTILVLVRARFSNWAELIKPFSPFCPLAQFKVLSDLQVFECERDKTLWQQSWVDSVVFVLHPTEPTRALALVESAILDLPDFPLIGGLGAAGIYQFDVPTSLAMQFYEHKSHGSVLLDGLTEHAKDLLTKHGRLVRCCDYDEAFARIKPHVADLLTSQAKCFTVHLSSRFRGPAVWNRLSSPRRALSVPASLPSASMPQSTARDAPVYIPSSTDKTES